MEKEASGDDTLGWNWNFCLTQVREIFRKQATAERGLKINN